MADTYTKTNAQITDRLAALGRAAFRVMVQGEPDGPRMEIIIDIPDEFIVALAWKAYKSKGGQAAQGVQQYRVAPATARVVRS